MADEDLNLTIGAIFDPDDDVMVRRMFALIDKIGAASDKRSEEWARKSAKSEWQAKAKAANKANKDLNRDLLNAQKARAAAEKKASQQEMIALKFIIKAKQSALDDAEKRRRSQERNAEFARLGDQKSQAKLRLANELASLREGSALNRKADRERLEAIKTAGRSQYVAEQGAEARRTARTKAFLRGLSTTYSSGLRAGQSVLTSVLRRRENSHAESERRITNQTRQGITQQTSVVRQQLDAQNGTYTRAAQKRLATIERAQANETKVITRGAVKQAEAQAKIQAQLSGGVLGAAGGKSLGAGGLLGILAGAGAGRYTYDVLADFQSIQTTFRGIFEEVNGNAPRTEAFLDDLRDFAKKTPFTLRSLADYAQKFFANGLVDPKSPKAVQELTDKLLKLADAGAATGKTTDQINGAVLGLTQISASGRLSLEDLRQVTEGIGLRLSDVAAELGLTTGELFESLEKGKVNAVDGLDAIFKAMTKIPGAAGAAARQSGNLRGAFSNLQDVIDSLIVKYLSPLGTKLAKTISAFAEFIGKLSEGKGIYKIVRDGLTGIAIALGLIIAAKGAVQVLGLLNGVLRLLAANPGIVALVTLGAAAGILYRNVPGIRSFFESLVKGTKDWFRVGWQLKEPITGLSEIVALQTSFGAAARIIADGLGDIGNGVKSLLAGGGGGQLSQALSDVRKELATKLAPANDVLSKWLRSAVAEAADYLSTAQLNVGAFLVTALGLKGGSGGVVSRLMRRAIGSLFADAFDDLSSAKGAAELGKKLNETVKGAIDFVRDAGLNVGSFIAGLFTGNVDLGSAANNMGVQLRWLIEDGIAKIGDVTAPFMKVLGQVGSAIGDFFTRFVLPKLIEFPRILGRFLSRTLFSEGFLRAVTIAGAALAGLAVVIAGQFVRGFLEGLWQRRGDIATVLLDILKFAVGAVIGSGNPFIILGASLLAVFAGAKIVGAISNLRGLFKVAAVGMKGDLQATQLEAEKLAAKMRGVTGDSVTGPGGRVGNAALGLGNLGRGVSKGLDAAAVGLYNLTGVAEKTATTVGGSFDKAGARVTAFGEGILGTAGKYRDASGQMRTNNGRFAADTEKNLGRVKRSVGQAAVATGNFLQDVPRGAKLAFDKVGSVATTGYGKLREQAAKAHQYQKDNFSATQATAQLALGAMAGYAAGYADDAISQSAAAVGAIGNIATAFAAGPIVGSIAVVGTAIGLLVGRAQKESAKAKARAKADAAETKAIIDSIRGSADSSFSDTGDTGSAGVVAAQSKILTDAAKQGSGAYKAFRNGFEGDTDAVILAAAAGKSALKDYTTALTNTAIDKALRGNTDTLADFSKEARIAGSDAEKFLSGTALKGGFVSHGLSDEVNRLTLGITTGKVSRKEFIADLEAAGFSGKQARDGYKAYADSLARNIGSSSGGVWLKALPGTLEAARRKQVEVNEVNAETDRRLDGFAPIAERFASAYERIKTALDKAKQAYTDWIDASTGRQQTRNEAVLDLFGAARDNVAPGVEGETAIEAAARKSQNFIEAQRTVAGQIAQLASESGGNVEILKGKLADFFAELRNAPGVDQSTKDFLTLLQGSISDDALLNALGSQEAIGTIKGVETKLSDLLELPEKHPMKLALQKAQSFDQTRLLIAGEIKSLYDSDPTVRAFMDKGDGYQANLDKILADAGYISSLTPTLNVKVKMDWTEFYKGQAALANLNNGAKRDGMRSAQGRLAMRPMVSSLAEEGPEVVLPLTKPARMKSLLSIPLVADAIDRVAPTEVSLPTADPFSPAGAAPTDGEHLNVTQHIYETQNPRLTALESVRAQRAAQFRSGRTLSRRRPALAGAPS